MIEQGPPGRGRVKTFLRAAESLPRVWAFLREKLAQGRQAYVIYSRVEDADTSAGVKAATREWHHLEKVFAPWKAGLLHGRLKSQEKEQVMAAFRAGQTQVLLATSVVEVGVDVPNATLMVIENAEQFGLAQLHQLRGRIGRGAEESYCILIAGGQIRRRARAAENDGGDHRWFSHCGGGLENARGRGVAGPAAERRAPAAFWRPGGGRGVGRTRPRAGCAPGRANRKRRCRGEDKRRQVCAIKRRIIPPASCQPPVADVLLGCFSGG